MNTVLSPALMKKKHEEILKEITAENAKGNIITPTQNTALSPSISLNTNSTTVRLNTKSPTPLSLLPIAPTEPLNSRSASSSIHSNGCCIDPETFHKFTYSPSERSAIINYKNLGTMPSANDSTPQ
eukprot:231628_1